MNLVSKCFIIWECSTQTLNATVRLISKNVMNWIEKKKKAYNEEILNAEQGAFTIFVLPTNGSGRLGRKSQKVLEKVIIKNIRETLLAILCRFIMNSKKNSFSLVESIRLHGNRTLPMQGYDYRTMICKKSKISLGN